MLRSFLFALSLLLALPLSAAAPSIDPSELINEAGRLRMLSERMGKAYAQIALGVMAGKAQEQIALSRQRFEANLSLLERGITSPRQRSALDTLKATYASYVRGLVKPADKASVAAVHGVTEKLVADADQLTAAFEATAGTATAKIINVSGRQRMLSQRMARLYFAAALGNGKADIDTYRNEFSKGLAVLDAAPLSSTAIRREIELARTQWLFLEQALAGGVAHPATVLANVATTSERLLETMDNLTALYSKSLRYLVGATAVPSRA